KRSVRLRRPAALRRRRVLAGLRLVLSDQHVELGACHRDVLVRAGPLSVAFAALTDALLELGLGLAQRTGQLGELAAPEEQGDDGKDDEQVGTDDLGEDQLHSPPSLSAGCKDMSLRVGGSPVASSETGASSSTSRESAPRISEETLSDHRRNSAM